MLGGAAEHVNANGQIGLRKRAGFA
jgi:hypothetical protein